MSEYTPPGKKVKMTKAQMRKYLKNMEEARKIAQAKLDEAKASGVFEKEAQELAALESKLDEWA